MAFNSLGQQGLSVSAFLCPVCIVLSLLFPLVSASLT